jgi:hypothetical protein
MQKPASPSAGLWHLRESLRHKGAWKNQNITEFQKRCPPTGRLSKTPVAGTLIAFITLKNQSVGKRRRSHESLAGQNRRGLYLLWWKQQEEIQVIRM